MIDDRRHAQIKAALGLRGRTLSDIARSLDVAPTTISIVSRGFRRSQRIEAAIAHELGLAAAQLWPDRYPAAQPKEAAVPAP